METPKPAVFNFVAANGVGSPHKRHQVARACDACRRRKKRCYHENPGPERTSTNVSAPSNSGDSVISVGTSEHVDSHQNQTQSGNLVPSATSQVSVSPNASLDNSTSRYIGDLSPEAILAEAVR